MATIGPATRSVEQVNALIAAGVDIVRLNFSHGTHDDHAENVAIVREAARLAGKQVGVLGDLPGPKIRLSDVAGSVELRNGSEVVLTTDRLSGGPERLAVSWNGLPRAVRRDGEVHIADGRIRLRVRASDDREVRCKVEVGGTIEAHQGVNLPGASVDLPAAGQADLAWVRFAVEHGIDLLAVSFVRRAMDLARVERAIAHAGADIPLIAKIERPEATDRAEEIVGAATAGIMVARGDLGIELPIERVPVIQRRLLELAGTRSRASITATQMLASMVDSPRPTRAEVSDVANAILQGTDAVMLSEETAVGRHAVEAVKTMDRIARVTESELPFERWNFSRVVAEGDDIAASVARAAVGASHALGVAALVVPTNTGRTALLVSSHRPRVPVLAVSPRIETVRRLNLLFGVIPTHADQVDALASLIDDCARLARQHGIARSGDLIGITAGLPEQKLGTNLFEVHRVP